MLLGMGAVMGFGWYKLVNGIREAKYLPFPPATDPKTQLTAPHSELAREKMWARIHLTPLLQAEEDRDQVRRYWADLAREKELLGENKQVYHSERCVPRYFEAGASSLTQSQIRAPDVRRHAPADKRLDGESWAGCCTYKTTGFSLLWNTTCSRHTAHIRFL